MVEDKIPDVSSLVKKTNYDTEINELEKKLTDHNHDKHITTTEFNTLAAHVFNARLAQVNLIEKSPQLNQNIYLLKIKWKNWKHFVCLIKMLQFLLQKILNSIQN